MKRSVNWMRYAGTCRHEATHAVIGEVMGFRVKRVLISHDGPRTGITLFDRRMRHGRFAHAVMVLSASLVERPRKRIGRYLQVNGDAKDGDFGQMLTCGLPARPKTRRQSAEWDVVEIAARYLVQRYMPAIQCVAHILRERDVSGDEVRRFIGRWH